MYLVNTCLCVCVQCITHEKYETQEDNICFQWLLNTKNETYLTPGLLLNDIIEQTRIGLGSNGCVFTAVLGFDKNDKEVLILHRVADKVKMAACLKKGFRM